MGSLRLAVVYFSATQVTHTYAEEINRELERLGCTTRMHNITSFTAREQPVPLTDYNGVIFGFPVFADFAPSVVNQWLQTLNGAGLPAAMFFTFGGRTTGYAHFHTLELLSVAGFRVLLTAELLGRHSFNVTGWTALTDRPNADDLAVARDYAGVFFERLSWPSLPSLTLQKPFAYDMALQRLNKHQPSDERGWCHPVRTTEECTSCRLCEDECPSRAFDAEIGQSDPRRCIECMRCVYLCPEGAIAADERMGKAYGEFLRHWRLSEELMQAKRSRIITEAWQAAG